ncbi:MAG: hypothetical protein QG657_5078 [Acidobacteriota bacterium]|nr:hypothetical protein [Acidobacteriota bacterium]
MRKFIGDTRSTEVSYAERKSLSLLFYKDCIIIVRQRKYKGSVLVSDDIPWNRQ